jgi:hypothetical protein
VEIRRKQTRVKRFVDDGRHVRVDSDSSGDIVGRLDFRPDIYEHIRWKDALPQNGRAESCCHAP